MYFLSNFCRVCVTSDEKLTHIDNRDYDAISYSVKLKSCTRMVLEMDSWSAFICEKCIVKLRISYDFNLMCCKSTSVLKNYLSEILGNSENEASKIFENSQVKVSMPKLSPQQLPKMQRKYVSKGIRCSLLKELLTKIEDDKKKEKKVKSQLVSFNINGLKPLINFTKFYNYGYKLENNQIESIKYDPTPLDKLTDFVNNYFRINFSHFHDNVNAVLDESERWLDENDFEEMLKPCPESQVKFEEVIIEPDINIKKEIYDDEYDNDYEYNYPTTSDHIKIENIKTEGDIHTLSHPYLGHTDCDQSNPGSSSNNQCYSPLDQQNQSSLELLKEFTVKFKKHRGFSPQNYRCRTRNHPFISPQLKNQFLHQDFSCNVCKRRFKSHGYLHAHRSKMKHWQ
ncbi:uncharacterized protein [Onthophagus taurus]|uniref:uncharacterized protein n=1 Tax=Onthophagus taurus TaxID=166361 RepID=UPI000C1FFC5C|nr:uncharacterized protein LOC111414978 [Onthophagus taurus]